MKTRTLILVIAIAVLIALTIPTGVIAQNAAAQTKTSTHHHYKFVDLGTFGGPSSYFSNGLDGVLTANGTSAGWADTSVPDPFPAFPFNPDGFVSHAFASHNGVLTDLGSLPGGASSQAFWISANGLIAGNSQNGEIDPLIAGFPQNRAVLWKHGSIIDLGTLGGGYESLVNTVNSRGQVVGLAFNTIPDPYNGIFVTQSRAFLWEKGAMQDLGTLGGPDASAVMINESGQVAGVSFTNSMPNPVLDNCGGFAVNVPTQDPFVWNKGQMTDLGTLGGTCGVVSGQNNRGQVIGQSDLLGDLTFHPYIWSKTTGMQDLGTLGGDTGEVSWISDSGSVVGKADLPGPAPQNHDAVLWTNSGAQLIDLGTLPGDACANAYYVNSRGQVVGTSEDEALCRIPTGEHAFLWENGGPMVDLNSLIPVGSSLELTFAFAINDSGEIVGVGVPSGCAPQDVNLCGHAFVLIPCDDDHSNLEACDYSLVDASATAADRPTPTQRPTTAHPWVSGTANPMVRFFGHRSMPWYRNLGVQPPPK